MGGLGIFEQGEEAIKNALWVEGEISAKCQVHRRRQERIGGGGRRKAKEKPYEQGGS
jgi:hypothetical protein